MRQICTILGGTIIGLSLSAFPLQLPFISQIQAVEAPKPTNEQLYQLEEKTRLEGILSDLRYCESSNRENIIITDTNGYKSYGIFQFQLYSFIEFGIKYGLLPPDITEEEARGKIMDTELTNQIAANMLEDGLWKHWYNCLRRYYE